MGCGPSKSKKKPVDVAVSSKRQLPKDFRFKVLVVGDANVGKTSLIARLCGQNFQPVPIIDPDGITHTVTVDAQPINLQVWDTEGQERFRLITSTFYKGADGILFAYDVGNIESFKNIEKWVVESRRMVPEEHVPTQILISTKNDSQSPKKLISAEQAEGEVSRFNFNGFYETSAFEGVGITECFHFLAQELYSQWVESHQDKILS